MNCFPQYFLDNFGKFWKDRRNKEQHRSDFEPKGRPTIGTDYWKCLMLAWHYVHTTWSWPNSSRLCTCPLLMRRLQFPTLVLYYNWKITLFILIWYWSRYCIYNKNDVYEKKITVEVEENFTTVETQNIYSLFGVDIQIWAHNTLLHKRIIHRSKQE